jgi:hypothetical protein
MMVPKLHEEATMQKRKVSTAVAGLLALAACTDLAHAQSAPSPTTTIAFPMIGIGFNQTLQVNVITYPPNPCAVLVSVYSATGEVIVSFEEGDPGKPLQLGNVVSSFPHRMEVRPEVTLTPSPTAASSACAAQATAEIFDNFTKTAWVVALGDCHPPGPNTMPIGPAFCPGPNVYPPKPIMPIYLGPVGLTFEQTARLNVVAPHPPDPCIGTLGFIDPRGIAIIPPNPQQGSGQSGPRGWPSGLSGFDRAGGRGRYGSPAARGCRCLHADDRTAVLHRLIGGVRPRYRLDAYLLPAGAKCCAGTSTVIPLRAPQ